jgi:two-component system chemotaxis response regulator CheY
MSSRAPVIMVVDDARFMRQVLIDIIKTNGLSREIVEAVDGMLKKNIQFTIQ